VKVFFGVRPQVLYRSLLIHFLYGIAAAAVLTRSDTHNFLEPFGKMALISKTGFETNLDNGKALGEEASDVINPLLNQVRMRRQTYRSPKKAQQMKFTEIRDI